MPPANTKIDTKGPAAKPYNGTILNNMNNKEIPKYQPKIDKNTKVKEYEVRIIN